MKKWAFKIVATMALAIGAGSVVHAADDAGKVLLRVSGKIANTNDKAKKSFNLTFDDLKKLPDATVQATNEWVPAKSKFTGPLIREVLKAAGAKPDAKEVILVGADGYRARAPMADFTKFEVIAAHTLNGTRMTTETKGPLWIMYPMDERAADLPHNETGAKLVWNVVALEVR